MTDPQPPAVADDRVAGRYHVEALLGRGGMGAVYRVFDERSGKNMALKRSWSNDHRKVQQRGVALEREYHQLAQLAHPRVIEVYEYGLDQAGPYYTMELLEGGDLDADEERPWPRQCALLFDVASPLAMLHARGLIHRDVSLRNVRCTPEGRAKLIDFGAMTAMGAAREMVGTPPFVAPEALQLQELDARVDLFSLGALAYYLLTGRHAYPARRLRDLPNLWRSRPIAPVQLAPEMPEALNALVMQLLSLDRSARPRSAAEVMERLAKLAGFELDERIEVSRAYLTTPALVGREQALLRARRQIMSLARRAGGSLLIEGEAGSGRSRMLSACVLEGKLLGANVIRADASAGAEDWAVARSLCAQLFELIPDEAREAAQLRADTLGHVLDGLMQAAPPAPLPERSTLLRALCDFVLQLARRQPLLIAVDDVDLIDEPSAAWLAALAHDIAGRRLLLALSISAADNERTRASLRLLHAVAQSIEIGPLSPEQTQSLIASVFGDVPNVQFVAGKLHALAQGNPRGLMDLAQQLRERGLARYQAGSWLLPKQLGEEELPHSLTDALAQRIAGLSTHARELVETLSLAEGDGLTLADCPQLLPHAQNTHAFAALEESIAARVLIAEGERYRFSQPSFLAVLHAQLSPERRTALHLRLAELLQQIAGDPLRRAEHLLGAGRERDAIELLCSIDLQAQLPPVALLETAIAQAEALHLPKATLHRLRIALLSKASVVLAADAFRRCLTPVLRQLESDSGLACYAELPHLPAPARLQQALASTRERQLALPDEERVHPVGDAIRELGRIAGAMCSYAMQLNDLHALESLPALAPLLPLSPALSLVASIVEACRQWLSGRYLHHRRIADECMSRIAAADRAGLDEAQAKRTRLGLHYALALFEAAMGSERAEQRASVLEGELDHRVNAWRIRMQLHLSQGDIDEARRCQHRAELSQLQMDSEHRYFGMGAMWELVTLADIGDLVGVKSALDAVSAMAEEHAGWRAAKAYGLCRYRWLQGDVEAALEALLPAFELAPPLRHPAFCWLVGAHVRLLVELGRNDEALSYGREYLALFQREQLVAPDQGLPIGMAQALSVAGEHQAAARTIESAIALSEELGCVGFALGRLYETRARIAIAAGDGVAYEQASERCANEYLRAHNPALDARFARLADEARREGGWGGESQDEVGQVLESPQQPNNAETAERRLLERADEDDRVHRALERLLQALDCNVGYLFATRATRPVLLAGIPALPADPELIRWIERRVRSSTTARYSDLDGRTLEAVFLRAGNDEQGEIVAVLALQARAEPRTSMPERLLEEVAKEVLEHAAVNAMPFSELVTQ